MRLVFDQAELFRRVDDWLASYANAEHLRRTADWLRVLEPNAPLALLLAGLTHDMERAVPGPDRINYDARHGPNDPTYNRHHSARSARIVAAWLREQGASDDLIADVARLIEMHEDGGWPEADLLQAADSLSFLDVNVDLLLSWLPTRKNHTGLAEAREKLDYTFDRIKVPRARDLARPLYDRALQRLAEYEKTDSHRRDAEEAEKKL
jgi:hypothetical protein